MILRITVNATNAINHIAIRRASPEDAKAFIELFEAITAATIYLGFEAGERSMSVEAQAGIFERQSASGDIHLLAFEDGDAIGFASVMRQSRRKFRHIGAFVIGVHPAWQGRGVATFLCDSVAACAREEGMTRLELTVAVENHQAVRLYLSRGFALEGTRRGSMNCSGQLLDEYYMAKAL